jgi:hypothetical protein
MLRIFGRQTSRIGDQHWASRNVAWCMMRRSSQQGENKQQLAWCKDESSARNMAMGDGGPGMLAVVLEAN